MARRLRSTYPQELHAKGVWHLLWGDLDDGIATLHRAVLEAPSTSLESDLAAAYLLRSVEQERGTDMILALEMADRAVKREPSLTAYFNRGLALESLHLYEEATAAWEEYLGVETDPGWREEAEEHLNRCRSADRRFDREEIEAALLGPGVAPDSLDDLVSAAPSLSRRLVLAELLSGARADGGAEGRAAAIAAAVEKVTSDPSLVAEVSLARAAGRGSEKLYRLYGLARHHYDTFEIQLAFDAFTQAQQQVAHPNSPLDFWIEYYRAVCQYWFGDLEPARKLLVNLASRVPAAWLDLRGHIQWMLGLISANQGSPVAALDLYRQAFDVFAEGSFRQEAAFLRVLMAEELLDLGDSEGAMAHLLGALADADWILRPNLARGLYERAAEAARRVGCPKVALYFEDRTLKVAERVREPLVVAEGHYLRSLTRLELGDQVGARTDLEAARQWQGEIADPFARRMVEAGIRLAESRLPERPRQESMESLSAAIANIGEQGASAVLPTLLYERSVRRLHVGDPVGARADLKEAARLLVSQTISRPGELATRWKREQIRDVFGSLADLLDADDEAVAHSLVGRRLELNSTVDSLDRTVDELRRRWMTVDQHSAVVATRFAGDHLIVWLAYAGRSERISLPLPLSEAEALFTTLLRNRTSPEADMALRRFAERLEPLLTAIRSTRTKRLFWIQDVPLMGFPVAALPDPHTGEPLIRDYTVVMVEHLATSASSKLHRDWRGASFFGVGDPDLKSSVLPPLPMARREVQEIARLFHQATVLIGDKATKEAVLRHAPHETVLHFAAHALTGRAGPHRSRLLLSGDGEDGVLWGREILALDLSGVDLVVLSACHSSSRPGLNSLAQAFLGAGAGAVIGSSWEVTDRSAQSLLTEFYDHLIDQATPEEALRQAQLAAIDAGHSWSEWAAFQLIINRN